MEGPERFTGGCACAAASASSRRGGVAELQPAGAEWRVRWLHGTADLNRQGNGTATVRVTAPGLYRVRSVASARRARDAYNDLAWP
ncbi:hypothetical protein GTZ93_16280 [Corallococcus exiguus]|uniref:Uncharacterized protein n=1 Tax=Corallococcus exiguus TaxID=83462 RepID=A0A7X5BRZ8_9BACT|nr:hypothetical protein [Corallococcus exiguus]TNV67008.1 hypothetical protein FH620_03325 [Corallococcus exiguus]